MKNTLIDINTMAIGSLNEYEKHGKYSIVRKCTLAAVRAMIANRIGTYIIDDVLYILIYSPISRGYDYIPYTNINELQS